MAIVPYGFTLAEWVGSAGATLSEHGYGKEGSVVPAKPRLCARLFNASVAIVRMKGWKVARILMISETSNNGG